MPTGARNERTPLPEELDPILERFELAWHEQPFPALDAFLPDGESGDLQSQPARREILAELIKIDLEYRWRGPWGPAESAAAAAPSPGAAPDRRLPPGKATLEQYREHYPELRLDDAAAVDLIAEEYRVRMRWGDRPALDHYLERFPDASGLLRTVLQWVDDELRSEQARAFASPSAAGNLGVETIPLPLSSSAVTPVKHGRAPASAEELLRQLLESRLVSPAGLSELRSLVSSDGLPLAAHELAEKMVREGWITEHQRDELLQGRFRGLVLGEYAILEKLGEGGMGVVFKAEHRRMERIVALKVLAPAFTTNHAAVSRFHREVKAAAKLVHPNIVLALDAGQEGDVHFLVMEFVSGIDLRRLVKEQGKLPVRKALNYLLQAAQGLQFAHRAGIVHRDIKPANLLLDMLGTVKVADLGLARFHNELGPGAQAATPSPLASAELTAAGSILGTVDYMAPEQILNPREADHRADIYSLGCTLYFLLTGQPPFSSGSAAERMAAHREAPPPSLAAARPDVSPRLDAAYRRMLAKQPLERQPSVTALIVELQACLHEADFTRGAGSSVSDSDAAPPADGWESFEAEPVDDSSAAGSPIVPAPRRGSRNAILGTIAICLLLVGVRAANVARDKFALPTEPAAEAPLGGSQPDPPRTGAPGTEVSPPPDAGNEAAPHLAESPPAQVAPSKSGENEGAPAATPAASVARRWALLIACGGRENGDAEEPDVCAADVQWLAETLIEAGDFAKEDVWVRIEPGRASNDDEEPATPLEEELAARLSKAGPDDLALVYISGFGLIDPASKQWRLALPNRGRPASSSAGLPMSRLHEFMRGCRATKKALIVDADLLPEDPALQPGKGVPAGSLGARFEGLITLTSCKAGQPSCVWRERGHRVFGYYLIQGLAGAADYDEDQSVDHLELYRYLLIHVPEEAARLGHEQTPVLTDDESSGVLRLMRRPSRADQSPAQAPDSPRSGAQK